jgi:hypothetical protein
MKGRAVVWSAAERDWIKANATRLRREAWAEFVILFNRPDVLFGAFNALCKREGWRTGRTGRLGPDHPSWRWNAGKKMPFNAASAATRFKPGCLTGQARHNWVPVGTERLSDDGYLERKVSEDAMPARRRWVLVHRLNWEAVHGPVPRGHALKSLDGNRMNVAAENWIAVPRALLPHLVPGRHGTGLAYDAAAPELKPSILALAQLRHAAGQAKRRGVAA